MALCEALRHVPNSIGFPFEGFGDRLRLVPHLLKRQLHSTPSVGVQRCICGDARRSFPFLLSQGNEQGLAIFAQS
jgi:hypothetical protein